MTAANEELKSDGQRKRRRLCGRHYRRPPGTTPILGTPSRHNVATASSTRTRTFLARNRVLERSRARRRGGRRSEEHTSELQSRGHLVCRLLLEKKKR